MSYTAQMFYIALFFIALFFLAFKPLTRRHAKLPPGPRGLPVIGSLHRLGSRPHQSLAELAAVHGHLMTLKLGCITTIVASSPETVKEIFQKHGKNFPDRTVPDAVTAQDDTDTIAWVPADGRWRSRRRICSTQMFTTQRLDSLRHLRHQKAQQLVSYIRKRSAAGAPVEIGRVAFATTLNMITNTMFSVDMVDPDFESAQEFKDLIWRIMEEAGKSNLSDYFPVLRWVDLQGVKRRIRHAYMRLHEIFDEIIDKRMEDRAIGKSRNGDFLDVLLDQCEEDGSGFTRQSIKPLILDLFAAGSDTSAITVEWAMAELLKNPEAMQKAKQEIVEKIGLKQPVNESHIPQLSYLDAIVKETMRLHPAVPLLLPYKAENDVEIHGFTIPKNGKVIVNAWAIGRDPRHWENSLSFKPERFLNSNMNYKGGNFEYIPFGVGRRICIGMPLAIRMVHLLLASMIQSFDWRLPPLENLDMEEEFGITLKKAVPLRVIPSTI